MIDDMTSDPIGFARHEFELVDAVVPRFPERLARDGKSYQALLNGFLTAAGVVRDAATVVSRYIGGVYVDRAMVNQPGAGKPLTPVSLADQRRAMQLLRDEVFAPQAFGALDQSANELLAQRRGFDHFAYTEDPKVHDLALGIQKGVLDHLLHPVVLKRLTDSRLYGNEYSVANELVDLTDAVFAADLDQNVNTFRQNLQVEYVQRLLKIVEPGDGNKYDHVAQGMALDRLRWIEKQVARKRAGDLETTAHRQHVAYLIRHALDEPKA
jgi:hypothetical protein